MQENNIWIFAIGFLAQLFFSARILYQWIASEKAGKVLSPPAFWVLSILGSYLLFIYGVLRNDFAIILGQFMAYYIYMWNLNMQGQWKRIAGIIKVVLILTPLVATGFMLRDLSGFANTFLHNKAVPLWLLLFGLAGQVTFALRFIYQFIYSAAHHQSVLPIGFWIISLLGSSMIIAYALFRLDPVLILGQSFGFIAYTRNIMIGFKNKKNQRI
jgi:lipid-A-disaccharide synthase-like uncharacterized protein